MYSGYLYNIKRFVNISNEGAQSVFDSLIRFYRIKIFYAENYIGYAVNVDAFREEHRLTF